MIRKFLLVIFTIAFIPIDVANADVMFYGNNVYSPDVMYDDSEPQTSKHKMWYGGQEQADEQDAIFLRTSSTGNNWSSYVRVLTTADIPLDCPTGCFAGAVNDPSVTRHFNTSLQTYEWTMFYTVAMCRDLITPTDCNEQIWSSVSYDGGRTWQYHQVVTRGDASNLRFPTTPSALWTGSHWLVYFAEAGPNMNASVVHEMKVLWNRTVESYRIVYVAPAGFLTSNPEVRHVGNKAYLLFNSGSIYKVETTASPAQWGSTYPQALVPIPSTPFDGSICAAITPSLTQTSTGYDVFFSTPLWSANKCDVWHNAAIHRWNFSN